MPLAPSASRTAWWQQRMRLPHHSKSPFSMKCASVSCSIANTVQEWKSRSHRNRSARCASGAAQPHTKRLSRAAREPVRVDDALHRVDAPHDGDGTARQMELAVVLDGTAPESLRRRRSADAGHPCGHEGPRAHSCGYERPLVEACASTPCSPGAARATSRSCRTARGTARRCQAPGWRTARSCRR